MGILLSSKMSIEYLINIISLRSEIQIYKCCGWS